jgi:hypothetical protein
VSAAHDSALEAKYGEPLSNFAFNFNLRRYTMARQFVFSTFFSYTAGTFGYASFGRISGRGLTIVHFSPQAEPFLSLKPPL